MKGTYKIVILLTAASLALVTSCFYLLPYGWWTTAADVAILDGLSTDFPNPQMIQEAVSTLEQMGLTVDVYNGTDVTLGLYEKLPSLGYKMIIFRVHSAALIWEISDEGIWESPIQGIGGNVLFTAEPYTTDQYQAEQLSGLVARARTLYGDGEEFFAITPKFIETRMRGEFDKTVIVLMGCHGFVGFETPDAFLSKGASVYIGWERLVTPEHMDQALISLLSEMRSGATIGEAVDNVSSTLGRDPVYGSRLGFYPMERGGLRLVGED